MTSAPCPTETEVARFDAAVDSAFDLLRGRGALDRLMYAASELGDFSLIWHMISAGQALVGDENAEAASLRLSVGLGIESILVNGVIKSLFKRPRPAPPLTPRPHQLRTPHTSSFPSGHASAAACAVVLLADRRAPRRTAAYGAVAAIVAISRVHVGIHHASDVVGGAPIGAIIGLVIRRRWPLR